MESANFFIISSILSEGWLNGCRKIFMEGKVEGVVPLYYVTRRFWTPVPQYNSNAGNGEDNDGMDKKHIFCEHYLRNE